MRILLDECVPRPLMRAISIHEVRTVSDMNWAGKKNGELLKLMAENAFDVLLTTDQNLRHQLNPARLQVAVVLMVAKSNRLTDLLPLVPAVELALDGIEPGTLVEVCP
jgi:hypothetical protein